jgi:hypothetical protein
MSKTCRTQPLPNILDIIREEARRADFDEVYLLRIGFIESGGELDNCAFNNSGASGIYQIMPFHNVRDVFDVQTNIRWAINFTRQNEKFLRRNSIPVSHASLYLAHNQGVGGAKEIYKALVRRQRVKDLPSRIQKNVLAQNIVRLNDPVSVFWKWIVQKLEKAPLERWGVILRDKGNAATVNPSKDNILRRTAPRHKAVRQAGVIKEAVRAELQRPKTKVFVLSVLALASLSGWWYMRENKL